MAFTRSQGLRPPPRFHLLIGAAASGKSTAARILARLLQQSEQRPVRIISSAAIRQELHGDPHLLGRWPEVEAEIHRQLCEAIAAGETVILEACYVKRAFRLAITQALPLPVAVQWVGWWLDTPLAQCLQWNRRRPDPVPEAVIHKHCAQLLQAGPTPQRQEGFALVLRLQTGQGVPLETLIRHQLAELEPCLRHAANRDAAYGLHGYSRLLDQERLLYLLNLLSRYPKLTATSPTDQAATPQASTVRAAALLGRLHGACYGDPAAVALDLQWLEQQGFLVPLPPSGPTVAPAGAPPGPWQPVLPPPWPSERPRPLGGLSRLGDKEAFARVFTLLRHLLHHPFDTATATDSGSGVGVCEHLARSLNALQQQATPPIDDGEWTWRQVHAALTDTLTPYGFRLAGSSGRHGYALGTALLSLEQLVAAEALLRLQARHLGDGQAAALSATLAQRLGWIGVELEADAPLRRWLPAPPPLAAAGSLALQEQLETAIRQRQRLLIQRRRGGLENAGLERSAPLAIWPLQLVFQGRGWWLLFEHDAIGQRAALLEALPLEELHVFRLEARLGRPLAAHREALSRWEVLIRFGGSLHAGGELSAQLALCQAADPLAVAAGWERLQLGCSPAVMVAMRRELDRYPPQLIQLSRPLPGDSWGRPEARADLPPAQDSRHPYRLAVALPPWVLADDPELRRWLFSYGAAICLEAPRALVEEQRRWHQEALVGLASQAAEHDEDFTGCSAAATSGASAAAGRRPRKQRRSSASGAAHPCPLCGSPWVPLAPLGWLERGGGAEGASPALTASPPPTAGRAP